MDRAAWDERYAGTELLWTASANRFLVEEVGDLTPGRALDLACGEGRNAVWLAERGWDVVGVDFSTVALGKAQQLAAARGVRVAWRAEDVLAYRPEPGAFDLVAIVYLHLPAPQRTDVFGRAAAAVAPGGTLLVVGHDRTNPAEGYGGPQDEGILYGPEDVAGDLTGLDVVRADRVRRPVDTPEGERTAIDVLVRATRPA